MVTKQEVVVVREKILDLKEELSKVLPKQVPSDKFIRTVLTALTLNPGIAAASTNSILASCLKAATDGLLLDGREAALVVYRAKKGPVAQYMPMVYGIVKKVRQSGEVSVFNSFVVYENDSFEVTYGLKPDIVHTPPKEGPRGTIIGVYAVCLFKDATTDFEYMTIDEVEGIRKRSKAKNDGPWKTDFGEMARKTVIRRISKRLPMSTDTMGMVSRIDELYDLDAGSGVDEPTHRRKQAGAAAAALNEDDTDLEVDPVTGAVTINGEAEDVPEEKPQNLTAKQKAAAKAKADLANAAAKAEAAEKEADDEANGGEENDEARQGAPKGGEQGENESDSEGPEEGEETQSEDVI